jgi:hypothetical protein
MANKKVSQLTSKPSVLVTDLFPIADPATGQLFKTTISALGTAIGSGVSSVNTLVGAVVLDTDDIQELASPTNKWYTDTRSRAALSAGVGISYNSGTGVITNAVTSGQIATALGYTPADDALVVKLAGSQTITGTKTFQQAPLLDLGAGFKNSNGVYNYLQSLVTGWQIPVNGNNHNLIFSTTTNYVYTFPNASGTIALTSDLSNYVALTGDQTVAGIKTFTSNVKGTQFMVGTPFDTSRSFSAAGNQNSIAIWLEEYTSAGGGAPDLFFNNGRGTISSKANIQVADGLGGISWAGYVNGNFNSSITLGAGVVNIDTTNNQANADLSISQSYNSVNGTENLRLYANGGGLYIRGNVQGASFVKAGGTSAQFLKADGSIDSSTYLTTSSASSTYLPLTGGTLTGALAGTTASFSGLVQTSNRFYISGQFTPSNWISSGITFGYNTSGTQGWIQGAGSLALGTNGVSYLTIASTGISTFSSSVTATSFTAGSTSTSTDVLINLSADTGAFAIKNFRGSHSFSIYDHVASLDRVWIASDGKVGIATTVPRGVFDVRVASDRGMTVTGITSSETIISGMQGDVSANLRNLRIAGGSLFFNTGDGTNSSGTLAMTITSTGDVLINKSSLSASAVGVEFEKNTTTRMTVDGGTVLLLNRLTSDGTIADFRRSTTQVGSISVTTVATSYNVTSDYRLKEDLKPIKGLELVNRIKVYDYKWKSEDTRMDGVMAHELAEVLPYAVTGVKDGEQMQQVDYSKIVPVMVQAIKELKAELEALKNK